MASPAEKYPVRRTGELHKGRVSIPGARYFVTFVTHHRKPWLGQHPCADSVIAVLRAWHDEHDGAILAATVMPDHVHVLFELGQKLTAGRCVGRWKSDVRRAISFSHDWLRDFYEHRLLPDEPAEDHSLYIFLNPYRARLVSAGKPWPWWWAPAPRRFRFSEMLDVDGGPPREWLDWPDERFTKLAIGE